MLPPQASCLRLECGEKLLQEVGIGTVKLDSVKPALIAREVFAQKPQSYPKKFLPVGSFQLE